MVLIFKPFKNYSPDQIIDNQCNTILMFLIQNLYEKEATNFLAAFSPQVKTALMLSIEYNFQALVSILTNMDDLNLTDTQRTPQCTLLFCAA